MDCVQQPSGSKDIRTVGTVTHKINVRATDDSYQMTQQRMKEVEEERKGVRQKLTELYNALLCLVAVTYLQTCSIFAKLKTESRLSQSPIFSKIIRINHLLVGVAIFVSFVLRALALWFKAVRYFSHFLPNCPPTFLVDNLTPIQNGCL